MAIGNWKTLAELRTTIPAGQYREIGYTNVRMPAKPLPPLLQAPVLPQDSLQNCKTWPPKRELDLE